MEAAQLELISSRAAAGPAVGDFQVTGPVLGSSDQSVLGSLEDGEDPCPGKLPRCLLLFLT